MLPLVAAALETGDRAFESLYRLHRPQVFSYTLSVLRNVEDAEDATQTAFLNAYCALHRGVHPRENGSWLIAIARNVCRQRFRDAKRRPRQELLHEESWAVEPEEATFTLDEISHGLSTLN